MAVGEIWLFTSGQNMATYQTHCFGCEQFKNRYILKLSAYLTTLSFRRRTVVT